MVQVAAIEVYLTLRFHCERQFGFVFPHNRGSDSTMTEFHNTMVVPFNVHPATQSNTTLHYTVCKTMQHYATLCNTMQHYATLCNTMQHNPTLCNTMHYATQHYATLCKCNPCCCNTVQNASTVTVILSPMQAMYYNVELKRIQSIVWQCTINADLQESVNTTC